MLFLKQLLAWILLTHYLIEPILPPNYTYVLAVVNIYHPIMLAFGWTILYNDLARNRNGDASTVVERDRKW